ncbi:unnamed protein product [Cylicostephanus goldi]|uniref:Uncharacterized protein n=1 Tax=Cylicostephanus goldi TaxID=71465 RepID=A0A3P6RHR1_CYLGO|nr:unnamed protein product [Cylicostephanus goldi]
MMSPPSPRTPKGVLKSPESPRQSTQVDVASIQAIQNLRTELNHKLDLLITSIAAGATAKDAKNSDENSNLTPSPKRNSKVNFSDSDVK